MLALLPPERWNYMSQPLASVHHGHHCPTHTAHVPMMLRRKVEAFPSGRKGCFPAPSVQEMCPDCHLHVCTKWQFRLPSLLGVAQVFSIWWLSGPTGRLMWAMTVIPGGAWMAGAACLIWTWVVFVIGYGSHSLSTTKVWMQGSCCMSWW